MAVVSMQKLTLFGLLSERDALMNTLQMSGVVHLLEAKESLGEESLAFCRTEQYGVEIGRLDEEMSLLKTALDRLGKADNGRKPLFFTRRRISSHDEGEVQQNKERLLALADDILSAQNEINRIQAEQARIRHLIEILKPWKGYEGEIGFRSFHSVSDLLFTLDREHDFEKIQAEVSQAVPCGVLRCISSDKELYYVEGLVIRNEEEDFLNALLSYGYTKANFENVTGNPSVVIKRYEKNLLSFDEQIHALESSVLDKLSFKNDLEVLYDLCMVEKEQLLAREKLSMTKSTFYLDGWVPEPAAGSLEELLKRYTVSYTLREPLPEEAPPVLLKNNGFSSSSEGITEMYSLPDPREIDPNFMVTPFFVFFFGLMLSDAGYGLLLALGSAFFLWKYPLEGNTRRMLQLMTYCGLATVLCGALFGSWFGDMIPFLSGNPKLFRPLWFNPVDEPERMLQYALIFGIIHVYAGLLMKAANLIRRKQILDALLDVGVLLVLYTGFVFFAVQYVPLVNVEAVGPFVSLGIKMMLVGAVLALLTQGRKEKAFFSKISSGFSAIYGLVNFMSDVLSYSRLLAMGLATAVIASIVNQLGSMAGLDNVLGILVFVVVAIIGHMFNFAINALGAYVHSSRLQYIEFFGKFYEGGGKPFKPLGLQKKYTKTVDKE